MLIWEICWDEPAGGFSRRSVLIFYHNRRFHVVNNRSGAGGSLYLTLDEALADQANETAVLGPGLTEVWCSVMEADVIARHLRFRPGDPPPEVEFPDERRVIINGQLFLANPRSAAPPERDAWEWRVCSLAHLDSLSIHAGRDPGKHALPPPPNPAILPAA